MTSSCFLFSLSCNDPEGTYHSLSGCCHSLRGLCHSARGFNHSQRGLCHSVNCLGSWLIFSFCFIFFASFFNCFAFFLTSLAISYSSSGSTSSSCPVLSRYFSSSAACLLNKENIDYHFQYQIILINRFSSMWSILQINQSRAPGNANWCLNWKYNSKW